MKYFIISRYRIMKGTSPTAKYQVTVMLTMMAPMQVSQYFRKPLKVLPRICAEE